MVGGQPGITQLVRETRSLTPSPTSSLLCSSALDPPLPPAKPFPTAVAAVRGVHTTHQVLRSMHCTEPHFLSFTLYMTFFYSESNVLFGTSQRKRRCAKKKAIISPAHLPNPFNTQTKSTLDMKCVLFCTFSFVHKNTQRHMKEDYYILVLVFH